MEEDIKNLLETVVKRYIEEYIINLDLSDSTKNMLKRQLRKIFLDEDFIYDIKNNIGLIPKSRVKEKIEELNNVNNAEALEDLMNTKNYTITQLVQYVLQELLGKE